MLSHKKNQLRQKLKQILAGLSEQRKQEKQRRIVSNLEQLLKEILPSEESVVGGYAPLKDEVNWVPLLDSSLLLRTAFPAAGSEDPNDFSMGFYLCEYDQLTLDHSFGVPIHVPPKDSPAVEPAAILIPGLGFTESGLRLGRGKGYFDRYLEKYQGQKVGICFSDQIVSEIPTDEYDQNIDILVTDSGIVNCHQREGDKKK